MSEQDPPGPRCAAPRVRRPRARPPGPRAGPDRDVPPLARRHRRVRGCTSRTRWWSRRSRPTAGPPSRMVLLKGLDDRASCSTPTTSPRKGARDRRQPAASLLFPWHDLQRQVRVEGTASRVSAEESQAYFASPPPRVAARGLGVAAVPGGGLARRPRRAVRRRAGAVRRRGRRTAAAVVGRLPGRPELVEFWQGRKGRMHDRLVYRRTPATPRAVDRDRAPDSLGAG